MFAAAGSPEPFVTTFPWVSLLIPVLAGIVWSLHRLPHLLTPEGDES